MIVDQRHSTNTRILCNYTFPAGSVADLYYISSQFIWIIYDFTATSIHLKRMRVSYKIMFAFAFVQLRFQLMIYRLIDWLISKFIVKILQCTVSARDYSLAPRVTRRLSNDLLSTLPWCISTVTEATSSVFWQKLVEIMASHQLFITGCSFF